MADIRPRWSSEARARAEVIERSAGRCEGCYEPRQDIDWHHRWAQGQEGIWSPVNGVGLHGPGGAGGCHGWAHQNPTLAKVLGWIVQPVQDPGSGRVLTGEQQGMHLARQPLWLCTPSSPDGDWWVAGWFGDDPNAAAHVLVPIDARDYNLPWVPQGPPWASWARTRLSRTLTLERTYARSAPMARD